MSGFYEGCTGTLYDELQTDQPHAKEMRAALAYSVMLDDGEETGPIMEYYLAPVSDTKKKPVGDKRLFKVTDGTEPSE